jgi:hypothetical protein
VEFRQTGFFGFPSEVKRAQSFAGEEGIRPPLMTFPQLAKAFPFISPEKSDPKSTMDKFVK